MDAIPGIAGLLAPADEIEEGRLKDAPRIHPSMCPHLTLSAVGSSAKWCPDCWLLLPTEGGRIPKGIEGVLIHPGIWEDLREISKHLGSLPPGVSLGDIIKLVARVGPVPEGSA